MAALNDNDDIRKRPRAPTRYEIIDKDGNTHGPFHGIIQANAYAQEKWPDQEQDPDRTVRGWDCQVVGCE